MFNGDLKTFSWWKTKMYSHLMGLNEELWDVLEVGVGELVLDEEGAAAQKNLYKKHHKIRGILVVALPYKEYLKMSDKFTAKAMFASLCSNYEVTRKSEKLKLPCLFISMSCSR
jgi:hypothetical protein